LSTNEAFSRVAIDAQVRDQGWEVENPNAVRYEYVLPDKTKADYVLSDRHGRALAVIEAKRSRINPADAATQARAYAEQLKVPFIFLANGRGAHETTLRGERDHAGAVPRRPPRWSQVLRRAAGLPGVQRARSAT